MFLLWILIGLRTYERTTLYWDLISVVFFCCWNFWNASNRFIRNLGKSRPIDSIDRAGNFMKWSTRKTVLSWKNQVFSEINAKTQTFIMTIVSIFCIYHKKTDFFRFNSTHWVDQWSLSRNFPPDRLNRLVSISSEFPIFRHSAFPSIFQLFWTCWNFIK